MSRLRRINPVSGVDHPLEPPVSLEEHQTGPHLYGLVLHLGELPADPTYLPEDGVCRMWHIPDALKCNFGGTTYTLAPCESAQGDTGASGAQGDTGAGGDGDTGAQGDTGVGDTGATGDTGIGDTGAQGDTGVGDTGATGDTGVGDTGATGDTGVGDTGEQGDTGAGGGGGGDTITLVEAPDDHAYTGIDCDFTAGESVNPSFGKVFYLKLSDGRMWRADADAIITASAIAMCVDATTTAAAAATFLLYGIVRDDSWNWTLQGPIYLSTTVGGMSEGPPSGTDDVIQILGIATHADRMLFNPQLVQIEHV